MARIKIWQPIATDDLTPGLASSLRVANRESKRNWAVCRQVVVDEPAASQAEILQLRERMTWTNNKTNGMTLKKIVLTRF